MNYRRMPIEIESPEQLGYDQIGFNLAESSVTDQRLGDLGLALDDIVLAYGDHLGLPELRALLIEDAPALQPDHVLTTPGAAAALFIVATALLKPGDHMVVVFPNYATNIETPLQIGAEVERHPLRFEDGFRLDVDALAARIRPQTRLVSITLPHNPTGGLLPADELSRLVGLVEAAGCRLLVDETYREMAYAGPLPLAASLSPAVIGVSSLSKTYGLPGIRLGWLMTQDAALREILLAAKEQIFISTSVLDEQVALRFLRDRPARLAAIRARIQAHLQIMREWMAEEPLMEWVEPQGGVVCFPRIRPDAGVDVERFYAALNGDHRTFVGPGHWFGMDRRHMRIGFGWPTEAELRGGLSAISSALRDAAL